MEKELEEIEVDEDDLGPTIPEGISIDDPVRMYLKEIGKVPHLLLKRNRACPKMAKGDKEAKRKLAEANQISGKYS